MASRSQSVGRFSTSDVDSPTYQEDTEFRETISYYANDRQLAEQDPSRRRVLEQVQKHAEGGFKEVGKPFGHILKELHSLGKSSYLGHEVLDDRLDKIRDALEYDAPRRHRMPRSIESRWLIAFIFMTVVIWILVLLIIIGVLPIFTLNDRLVFINRAACTKGVVCPTAAPHYPYVASLQLAHSGKSWYYASFAALTVMTELSVRAATTEYRFRNQFEPDSGNVPPDSGKVPRYAFTASGWLRTDFVLLSIISWITVILLVFSLVLTDATANRLNSLPTIQGPVRARPFYIAAAVSIGVIALVAVAWSIMLARSGKTRETDSATNNAAGTNPPKRRRCKCLLRNRMHAAWIAACLLLLFSLFCYIFMMLDPWNSAALLNVSGPTSDAALQFNVSWASICGVAQSSDSEPCVQLPPVIGLAGNSSIDSLSLTSQIGIPELYADRLKDAVSSRTFVAFRRLVAGLAVMIAIGLLILVATIVSRSKNEKHDYPARRKARLRDRKSKEVVKKQKECDSKLEAVSDQEQQIRDLDAKLASEDEALDHAQRGAERKVLKEELGILENELRSLETDLETLKKELDSVVKNQPEKRSKTNPDDWILIEHLLANRRISGAAIVAYFVLVIILSCTAIYLTLDAAARTRKLVSGDDKLGFVSTLLSVQTTDGLDYGVGSGFVALTAVMYVLTLLGAILACCWGAVRVREEKSSAERWKSSNPPEDGHKRFLSAKPFVYSMDHMIEPETMEMIKRRFGAVRNAEERLTREGDWTRKYALEVPDDSTASEEDPLAKSNLKVLPLSNASNVPHDSTGETEISEKHPIPPGIDLRDESKETIAFNAAQNSMQANTTRARLANFLAAELDQVPHAMLTLQKQEVQGGNGGVRDLPVLAEDIERLDKAWNDSDRKVLPPEMRDLIERWANELLDIAKPYFAMVIRTRAFYSALLLAKTPDATRTLVNDDELRGISEGYRISKEHLDRVLQSLSKTKPVGEDLATASNGTKDLLGGLKSDRDGCLGALGINLDRNDFSRQLQAQKNYAHSLQGPILDDCLRSYRLKGAKGDVFRWWIDDDGFAKSLAKSIEILLGPDETRDSLSEDQLRATFSRLPEIWPEEFQSHWEGPDAALQLMDTEWIRIQCLHSMSKDGQKMVSVLDRFLERFASAPLADATTSQLSNALLKLRSSQASLFFLRTWQKKGPGGTGPKITPESSGRQGQLAFDAMASFRAILDTVLSSAMSYSTRYREALPRQSQDADVLALQNIHGNFSQLLDSYVDARQAELVDQSQTIPESLIVQDHHQHTDLLARMYDYLQEHISAAQRPSKSGELANPLIHELETWRDEVTSQIRAHVQASKPPDGASSGHKELATALARLLQKLDANSALFAQARPHGLADPMLDTTEVGLAQAAEVGGSDVGSREHGVGTTTVGDRPVTAVWRGRASSSKG